MQLFGSLPAIIQYVLAFAIILGLLAVLAATLRRITGNKGRLAYASGGRHHHHQQQRLGVIDAVDIDAQRQLLLLRRDNVEHLVLIGGPNDLLVESGIGRGAYRAPPQPQPRAETETENTPPPAVDGVARGAVPPASGVVQPFGAAPPPSSPLPPPPAFPPPPPPRSLATPVASRQPPAAPSFPEADPFVSRPAEAPASGKREQSVKADTPVREPAKEPKGAFSAVASQLEEALKRPFAAVRPSPAAGIDLDASNAPAAPETTRAPSAAAPVKPVQTSTSLATENGVDALTAPPTLPQRAELPLPPRFSALDEVSPSIKAAEPARPVKRSTLAAEVAPVASERQPTVKPETVQGLDSFSFGAPAPARTESLASPSSGPAAGDREQAARSAPVAPPPAPPRAGSAPASVLTSEAPLTERRKSADPADTFEVPRAAVSPSGAKADKPASTDPFDMSSLENIEAEFARLLGRASQDKGKDK